MLAFACCSCIFSICSLGVVKTSSCQRLQTLCCEPRLCSQYSNLRDIPALHVTLWAKVSSAYTLAYIHAYYTYIHQHTHWLSPLVVILVNMVQGLSVYPGYSAQLISKSSMPISFTSGKIRDEVSDCFGLRETPGVLQGPLWKADCLALLSQYGLFFVRFHCPCYRAHYDGVRVEHVQLKMTKNSQSMIKAAKVVALRLCFVDHLYGRIVSRVKLLPNLSSIYRWFCTGAVRLILVRSALSKYQLACQMSLCSFLSLRTCCFLKYFWLSSHCTRYGGVFKWALECLHAQSSAHRIVRSHVRPVQLTFIITFLSAEYSRMVWSPSQSLASLLLAASLK